MYSDVDPLDGPTTITTFGAAALASTGAGWLNPMAATATIAIRARGRRRSTRTAAGRAWLRPDMGGLLSRHHAGPRWGTATPRTASFRRTGWGCGADGVPGLGG